MAVSEGLRGSATQAKVQVVFDQLVGPTESDFRALIVRLQQAKADAIFLNVGLGQIGPLIRQLRVMRVSVPIYSNFWAAKPEVIEAAGAEMEGVMFVEMSTQLPNLPADTSGATLSAYVATHLLAQAAADYAPTSESFY